MKRINEAVQKRGLVTWFDENQLNGNTIDGMAKGIENSDVIVVFITDEYRNKVNGGESRDNCKFEFLHAHMQKGPELMIPVVMEPGMRNPREWTGALGFTLSTHLYVDFSSAFTEEALFDTKIDELVSKISALSSLRGDEYISN